MSSLQPESPIEAAARAALQRNDPAAATKAVIEGYGPEILSFLAARFRGNIAHADDAFAEFCEDVWRGLPQFQWRCSVRAWCYRLARNAASRLARAPRNRPGRVLPLNAIPGLEEIAQPTRASTQPYLQTEVKDEFQRLRERLLAADQELLILRVDRGLSWHDVAHAMNDTEAGSEHLQKAEVALRQRFVEVKRRLKELAREAGLL